MTAIIAGDYLYIDSGEITLWNGSGNGNFASDSATEQGDITIVPSTIDSKSGALHNNDTEGL